jgi:hypothetical protein
MESLEHGGSAIWKGEVASRRPPTGRTAVRPYISQVSAISRRQRERWRIAMRVQEGATAAAANMGVFLPTIPP